MKTIQRIKYFLETGIWSMRTRDLSKFTKLGVYSLRVLLVAIRDFTKDQCLMRASALTYYTLLTIVPVLAMAFGIAQGFGFQENLEQEIMTLLRGQEEIANQLLAFVAATLERTRGGLIAGIGVILLFYSVFRILFNIEDTMNTIWKVKEKRTPIRTLTDYVSLMILGPFTIILSGSLNVYIKATFERLTSRVEVLNNVSDFINLPIRLLPYVMVWLIFTLIYMVMPNRKVKIIPALIAGILAGTAYQLTQWGYITFQVGVSNANAVYGSFAALPLFLIWVQTSWTIILFGAEVSCAVQNRDLHEERQNVKRISPHFKKLLSLYVLHRIVQRFKAAEPPLSRESIAEALDLPLPIVVEVVAGLKSAGVIVGIPVEDESTVYQPARDIDLLKIVEVLHILDKDGVNELNIEPDSTYETLKNNLLQLEHFNKNSDFNILLKNL